MDKHKKPHFFLHSDLWKIQHFILTSVKKKTWKKNKRTNCPSTTLLWFTQATRRRQDRELKTVLWASASAGFGALGPAAQEPEGRSRGNFSPGSKIPAPYERSTHDTENSIC